MTATTVATDSGPATITVRVTDQNGGVSVGSYVLNVNARPTITDPADQTITAGSAATFQLTVGDAETAAGGLTVAATSSNPTLFPAGSLVVSGSGSSRTLIATPAAGQSGTATITVTVTDEDGATASQTINLTVSEPNRPPTITNIGDTSVVGGESTSAAFAVGDAETAVGSLTVTAASSNPALVPQTGLVLGGSGVDRTLTVTPAAGQTGTVTITVTVTDAAGATATDTFVLTVTGGDRTPDVAVVPAFAVGSGAGGAATVRFYDTNAQLLFSQPALGSGQTGGVRTATADFNLDGMPDIVIGSGPGSASLVRVIDGKDGKTELFQVAPFEATFVGGVYVAVGDVNADGVPDLIITPDEGGGPRVDMYSGKGFAKVLSFFGIDDPSFRGGARAAMADMNNDGIEDLMVAAGFGGGPRVASYDGKALQNEGGLVRIFGDFFVFEQSLRNGVFITTGDVNGDGFADLFVGGGPGGGPRVLGFDGKSLLSNQYVTVANFFAGDANSRTGVRITIKDLDNDAFGDVIATAGTRVIGYLGKNITPNSPPPEAFNFDAAAGTDLVFVG